MSQRRKIKTKSPLTYSIDERFEPKIRKFVDETKASTGITKRRIVSELIDEAIERRNFLRQNN